MPLSQAEFGRLVTEHGPALYRVAYRLVGDRHTAEDAVQDTFRSAWKSRSAYDKERHKNLTDETQSRPNAGERAWLTSILRRRVVDGWRKRPFPRVFGGETTLESEGYDADPLAADYTDEMQAALARLPKELKETLLLVVVGELTHQETANLLGVPLGTVLSRVSRARERLREYWLAEAKKRG